MIKKSRVFHFAQNGDTSGYFPQLVRWHDTDKYQVYFGTLNPIHDWLRTHMQKNGVAVFSCDSRARRSYISAVWRLAQFLRREQIDIVHTHLFEPSVVGLLAARLAGTPTRILTRHYSDYHTRINKRWHVRADRLCTALAHAVISVSEHTRKHMLEVENAPETKVHTIVNGIDFDRVQLSSPDAPKKIRAKYCSKDSDLLLTVGRMHPEKGYEFLLPAIARLKSESKRRFRLLVAGEGPFRQEFEQLSKELGCDDVVTFLGFRKDVPDLMAAADVFVLASVAEAFGLVVTESLYMGAPIVATRVGGIPEIVTHCEDGILVEPADSVALADGIKRLLDNPALRREMHGRGKRRVMTRFSFKDMVRSYENLYAKAISQAVPE